MDKSDEKLKLGDVVELRSGSIPMVVADMEGITIAVMYYNPIDGLIQTERVDDFCLKRVIQK